MSDQIMAAASAQSTGAPLLSSHNPRDNILKATNLPFDQDQSPFQYPFKPGQPSRPRSGSASLPSTSHVSRPVRSTAYSPSGRTYPPGLGPLSTISPIQLGAALSERPAVQSGARSPGSREALLGPEWIAEQLNSRAGASQPRAGWQRPAPQPARTSAGAEVQGFVPLVPVQAGAASTTSRSLPPIDPATFWARPHPPTSKPPAPNFFNLPQHPPSTPSHARIPSRASTVKYRSRSRPTAPTIGSAGSDIDTGVESDTTVRPGRLKAQSSSQPDLVAFRNRLEGWAGDVAARQMEGRRPHSTVAPAASTSSGLGGAFTLLPKEKPEVSQETKGLSRRKPVPSRQSPTRTSPLPTQGLPSVSPRSTAGGIPPLTPLAPEVSLAPLHSPDVRPTSGSSEDADDDLDSVDSPSSDSISFGSKRRQYIRRRVSVKDKEKDKAEDTSRPVGGLGLSLTDEPIADAGRGNVVDDGVEDNLFSLRLLAVFPAVWAFLYLIQAAVTGGIWVNLYPWGVITTRAALDRIMTGWTPDGIWESKNRGDLVLSAAWSILTGHYCFEMTTGLTYRWRVYYNLPATITRLLSIQCICWPLTGLTLWTLGPDRILFAWVVIGCTTAGSRSVQIYVTSNIIVGGSGADLTPRRKVSNPLPSRGRSPRHRAPETGGVGQTGSGFNGQKWQPAWLDRFKMDRQWDWYLLAREVGWKLGMMLLITTAWLFLGIETGRFVRGEV